MRFCVFSCRVRSRVRGFTFLLCLAVCVVGLALAPGSANRLSVGFAAGAPVLLTQASSTRGIAAINKRLRRYKKVKKELSGFSLEGGGLVAYFDGPSVVKIVANHYGEGGSALEEYYYSGGKLIFVFRKDQDYDRPLSGKVVRTEQTRFYFANDRLVRWIDETGKQVSPGTDEAQQKQKDYLEISSKFLAGARSKNATIEAE